jgi:GNAT superfamily N-acetyltransferase
MKISTNEKYFAIRLAQESDVKLIFNFIRELAEYEDLLDNVVLTEEILFDYLFNKKIAETIIGEYKDEPVGFALFFYNFSTFMGRAGIYLEDLYIKPEMRGKGYGKIILSYLGQVAKERECGKLELSCLNWNESSIKFYKSLGAEAVEDWTVYRISGEDLDKLANNLE